MLKNALLILWPSFLAACVGEMLFFALFDPEELAMAVHVPAPSRIAIYSLGFFFFWFLTGMAAAMTWLLARPAAEVNR
jgi:hypothetical protein